VELIMRTDAYLDHLLNGSDTMFLSTTLDMNLVLKTKKPLQ